MEVFQDFPHRRYNPLTDEWVLVSPQRSKRPWQGGLEAVNKPSTEAYDPTCYLCPGNNRINGVANPNYTGAYAFTNDFGALMLDVEDAKMMEEEGLFRMETEKGISRVICFSPAHNKTIPEMSVDAIVEVVELWKAEYMSLGAMECINYVQIFENKGAVMGCSNPHPHGQIWAQQSIPVEPLKKQQQQFAYYQQHGRTLLSDYLQAEIAKKDRVVFETEDMLCVVPFWAVWPFETMLITKRPMANITALSPSETRAFASAYQRSTQIYDRVFETSFPYSAGIHQSPTDGLEHPEWHVHMVFYPPLLRSASIKKFMVGYEMLANPQRDITPEWSAEKLRSLI